MEIVISDTIFVLKMEVEADRIEVAARMSRRLGREITKGNIDQWVAMSTPDRRIHADALKAMCEVIGNWQPLEVLVESCGFKLLSPEEAKAAEYGAAKVYGAALYQPSWQHADAIELLSNVGLINDYDFTTNWPINA